MEKRIDLEKRGKLPEEIKELNLDNCRSTSIVGLTDEYKNLETLSLINVGLTSLKGFPKLPNLKKLELSDNRINNGLNYLTTSPKLTHLNLSGNKIKDLEALQPLQDFKHLKNLDLFNNEATTIDNYREKVFNLIPSLKYLDGYDAEDREAEDSEGEDCDEEVNGNDDDSDEEEVSSEEDDDLDDGVNLNTVYSENLEDMSDGDYEGGEEEEEDGLEEEDEEDVDEEDGEEAPEESVRGKKRKHEDGEHEEDGDEEN